MKRQLIFVFLSLSLSTFGQLKFLPKDTISNFSLSYIRSGGGRDTYYSVDISTKGKIKVIFKGIGDEILGQKKIQLDANTFRQFKNSIITEGKIYLIKDNLNHNRVYDATSDVLKVKSNLGGKTIYGCGREQFDSEYDFIINQIKELVGSAIGNDSDLK